MEDWSKVMIDVIRDNELKDALTNYIVYADC